MRFGGALIASAALFLGSAAAAEAEEPICADRPGKATGTCTVEPGRLQVELGFGHWSHDRSGDARTDELSIAEAAFAYGVSERFHVQLNLSPFTRVRWLDGELSERARGFGDVGLSAKYRLTNGDAPVQIAMNPFVKIPTAKLALGNGKVEGGIAVPIQWSVPASALSLTLTPELDVNADSDGSGHHLGTAQVIGIGAELSPRLSVSAELWGYWDFDPAGTARQYTLGSSAAYLLSNDVQIDAGVDLGLSRDAPDVELYAGFAIRF